MENKITAVDWLVENLYYILKTEHYDIIDQAKEIEQEQIMNAWVKGVVSENNMTAEKYYNETYKQEE
jgi:hypothetical protein